MKTIFLAAFFGFGCALSAMAPRASAAPKTKASTRNSPAPLGLQVKNGEVLRNGKVFRGLGVNHFDAFYRTLRAPGDTSYRAGFATLKRDHVPFARLSLMGFWPSESTLYFSDKDEMTYDIMR
jgi:hypothetical protein